MSMKRAQGFFALAFRPHKNSRKIFPIEALALQVHGVHEAALEAAAAADADEGVAPELLIPLEWRSARGPLELPSRLAVEEGLVDVDEVSTLCYCRFDVLLELLDPGPLLLRGRELKGS